MINGVPVVAAPVEIDITSAEQLAAVLREAASGGRPVVVVDMTHTQFCDSSALHTLLRAHKRILAAGGELRLVIPADGTIPRIFTVMCLDRLIPSFASLEEALDQSPAEASRPSRSHRPIGHA